MKTFINVMFMLSVLAVTASSQTAQSGPASIPVHNLKIDLFAEDALRTLAERYHVVIGVHGTTAFEQETDSVKAIHPTLKDGTLGDVFDAIVREYPSFLQWTTSANGAVHFIEDGPLPLLDLLVRY